MASIKKIGIIICNRYHNLTHPAIGTRNSPEWQEKIKHVIEDETVRLLYD